MKPSLSEHFQARLPSPIRLTQIEFMKRTDDTRAVNVAIGNVSLPMHPAMVKRMFSLGAKGSPFEKGVVKYSSTLGEEETNRAFLHLIECSGFSTQGLYTQVTDGGSHAMELAILGLCGPAGSKKSPLFIFDPAYSNYQAFAERTGRSIVTLTRHLEENGKFTLPKLSTIETIIQEKKPAALLVIPYDNPTGQYFPQSTMNELAKLCVKHNLWLISDEAYREVFYTQDQASSIWGVTEKDAPGITGRRISIESASKIWNACGLRTGALITDNIEFHTRAVAENTANLCANVIGQYIFGALLHETKEELHAWFQKQRNYYRTMSQNLTTGLKKAVPKLIVSSPDAALYTVLDLRNVCGPAFNATDFCMYCAREGKVLINKIPTTLLLAPMADFYSPSEGAIHPGTSQMRIAYVEAPEIMAQIPTLFAQLLRDYLDQE
jgi:aspartate aminotransferase